MTYFKFNNKFYKQKYGLPIGNPRSGVLACLFLEFLVSGPFKYRLPSNTTHFRYIDDILIFLPQNIKIEEITEKLNNVEPSINFTYEEESNNTILFLDILIIKSRNNLTFKVYGKPTNKIDYMHFYSHHNKIKKGLILGFYLRALIICRSQYLDEEFEYIMHSLKSLKYQQIFILNARKKALRMHSSNKPKKNNPTILITHRLVSLPTNTHHITLNEKLSKLGIPIIQTISQTIKSLTNISKRSNNETTSHAGIYSIPSKNCNKHYIGETQHNLQKRIYEHK